MLVSAFKLIKQSWFSFKTLRSIKIQKWNKNLIKIIKCVWNNSSHMLPKSWTPVTFNISFWKLHREGEEKYGKGLTFYYTEIIVKIGPTSFLP